MIHYLTWGNMTGSLGDGTTVVKCANCGSPNIMFSKKRHVYICEDCACEFTAGNKPGHTRVFLSAAPDEFYPLALELKKSLEAAGHDVSLDQENARAGLDWASQGGRGRLVVLLTPAAVGRPNGYCLDDIGYAIQKKLPIIPVMVSRCEPPLPICRIQWLDMTGCHPVETRRDEFNEMTGQLISVLAGDRPEYSGAQSRLLRVLEPLPFDSDIQRHLARFTGRKWIFERVDAWLADATAPRIFWIVGPPGVGKSAIASWLCFNRQEVAAFHLCSYDDVRKSDPRKAVLSIAYQLSTQIPDYGTRLGSLNLESIVASASVKTLFDALITQPLSGSLSVEGRVAILIDGMDEATKGGKNELAELIASEFGKTPEWLRLIITSRPEAEVMHPLQGFTPHVLDAAAPENEQDIREFLAQELRPFAADSKPKMSTVDTIVRMSEGVFLYVEWIRKELSLKRLSLDRLDEFPRGLGGVYSQFFAREYPDVGAYSGRIRPALEVILAALEPLATGTISSIFAWDDYEEAEFFETLGTLFPVLDGRVRPFHKSLIDWIVDGERASVYAIGLDRGHGKLADSGWSEYARGISAMSAYMVAHLPAHLIRVERWADVKTILTDLAYFGIAWKANEYDVKEYWTTIESKAAASMGEAYGRLVSRPDEYPDHVLGVAALLGDTGHIAEALRLYDFIIGNRLKDKDLRTLQVALSKAGLIRTQRREFDQAIRLLKDEEALCRRTGDMFALQFCLINQLDILYEKRDLQGMIALNAEIKEMFGDDMDKNTLQRVLNAEGALLFQTGELSEALKKYLESEKLCRDINNVASLLMILNNKAIIMHAMGDLTEAIQAIGEVERIARRINNRQMLWYSLSNQADFVHDMGDYRRALALLEEARQIGMELENQDLVSGCLGNEAVIRHDMGDLDLAMQHHREEEAICRELGDDYGLQVCLGNQAVILYEQGKPGEALRLLKEKETICEAIPELSGLQAALGNEAIIAYDNGRLDDALAMHKKEEEICRKLGKLKDLWICLGNQAGILYARGDVAGAIEIYGEKLNVLKKSGFKNELPVSMIDYAMALYGKGEKEQASRVLDEAEAVCRELPSMSGLQACLGNRAVILYGDGCVYEALGLLREAEEICRSLGNKKGLALSLSDQAVILAYDQGDRAKGLERASEALKLAEDGGLKDLADSIRDLTARISIEP